MTKCLICQREYVTDYSKTKHEKLCKERSEAIKKHPERYKGKIK